MKWLLSELAPPNICVTLALLCWSVPAIILAQYQQRYGKLGLLPCGDRATQGDIVGLGIRVSVRPDHREDDI